MFVSHTGSVTTVFFFFFFATFFITAKLGQDRLGAKLASPQGSPLPREALTSVHSAELCPHGCWRWPAVTSHAPGPGLFK